MKRILAIIILTLCILAQETVQGASRTAILIGIDQYAQESQISPLRSAASDAQKLSRILSQNSYECQTIVDEDATKEQLTEAFIQIQIGQQTGQIGELDVFLCYFSGRGTRIPDDIQADETQDYLDECLLPSDAVADNPRSYIRDDALARWMSAIRAKQIILILDCAFWSDDANASVKGPGELPEAAELDGIEIADGLPPDVIILAAALPGARAEDGVFTTILLEACVTEEADKDGDRVISFTEAYQYASHQLQGQQQPRLVGAKNADIPLAPLPPLSRLRIESKPTGAEILLKSAGSKPATPGSEAQDTFVPLKFDEQQYTPAELPLKHGAYQVKVQKPGFFIPEAKEVAIMEYDILYPVEPFQLKPITVMGQTNTVNNTGESVSAGSSRLQPASGALILHVKALHEVSAERSEQADKEIYQETLPADGRFRFEPAAHQWLTVGSEYELHVTGQSVLAVESTSFTYDGYSDIHTTVTVTLDDIPPTLSPNGVTFQATRLILGEELRGSIKAQDDGLGLADTIEIQLRPPDTGVAYKPALRSISISASHIRFQTPGIYQFRYPLPETPAVVERTANSLVGEWSIAALTLRDKAGNTTHFSASQLNATFLVFANRFALGKHYFDAGNYTEALVQFKQVLSQAESLLLRDNARYLTALAYYQKDDLTRALETFQTIETKINYLGNARPKEMRQMPRRMVNKVWGRLLDNLDTHRTDAAYVNLLAATAEELGRSYEAKVYREYVKRLSEMVK